MGGFESWLSGPEGLIATCAIGAVDPLLLPHMTVDGCVGFVWHLEADRFTTGSSLHAGWSDLPDRADGGSTSGEGLDAQTWSLGRACVSLGTQDGDALDRRARSHAGIPHHWAGSVDLCLVRYLPTGLVVPLPALHPGDTASLHFIVAWEHDADAAEPWTWFAVDQAHAHVVREVEKGRPA